MINQLFITASISPKQEKWEFRYTDYDAQKNEFLILDIDHRTFLQEVKLHGLKLTKTEFVKEDDTIIYTYE